MNHLKYYYILILSLILTIQAHAMNNNYMTIVESNTPAIINMLNTQAKKDHIKRQSIGDIVLWTALHLQNKPYAGGLLDKRVPEYLYISLNYTDCMLFVEQVLAASELLKTGRLNINNLIQLTRELRYHGSLRYCNRNHYFKDWAGVNINKGYVSDEGYHLTGILFPFMANVMSARLAHSTKNIHKQFLSCIAEREQYINQQHLGLIPLKLLPKYLPFIHSGDIIGIVRLQSGGADAVHHLGIAYVHDNIVSMIHASDRGEFNKVIISPSLLNYLLHYKDSVGIILLRPLLNDKL